MNLQNITPQIHNASSIELFRAFFVIIFGLALIIPVAFLISTNHLVARFSDTGQTLTSALLSFLVITYRPIALFTLAHFSKFLSAKCKLTGLLTDKK